MSKQASYIDRFINTFRFLRTLCYAIVLPGQKSGLRAGSRRDSNRENLKNGPPAGRRPAGGAILRLSRLGSGRHPARKSDFGPEALLRNIRSIVCFGLAINPGGPRGPREAHGSSWEPPRSPRGLYGAVLSGPSASVTEPYRFPVAVRGFQSMSGCFVWFSAGFRTCVLVT